VSISTEWSVSLNGENCMERDTWMRTK
jgi:hypothetical protein